MNTNSVLVSSESSGVDIEKQETHFPSNNNEEGKILKLDCSSSKHSRSSNLNIESNFFDDLESFPDISSGEDILNQYPPSRRRTILLETLIEAEGDFNNEYIENLPPELLVKGNNSLELNQFPYLRTGSIVKAIKNGITGSCSEGYNFLIIKRNYCSGFNFKCSIVIGDCRFFRAPFWQKN